MINMEQLQQFVIAAELLSFSHTAQVLHTSTSTVSRNISLLEKYLDTQLFLRGDRGLTLTYAGQRLWKEGSHLLEELRNMEGSVRRAGVGMSGMLDISVQNFGDAPILDFLSEFARRFPDIDLRVKYMALPQIYHRLDAGQTDLAINYSYTVPKAFLNYDTYTLHSDEIVIAVPPGHRLVGREKIRREELKEEKILWVRQYEYATEPNRVESLLQELIPEYSRERNRTMPMLLQDLHLAMRIGCQLVAAPRQLCHQLAGNLSIVEIEDMDTSFELVTLWKNDNQNPALRVFLEELFRAFP